MTDTAKAGPTCSKRVSIDSWHQAACGRPVKDEGLCGIHLAAKRKRAANNVKREQHWQDEKKRIEAAKAAAAKVPNAMIHSGVSGYDGRIVVPASIADEYDALKAVEAAARKISPDIYRIGAAHLGRAADAEELYDALAALDAIRKQELAQ